MEKSYVLQLSEKKFEDLYLCFCGYSECESLHSFGPATRPNYLIHFILEGKGIYTVGEKTYQLKKGQGFLIEPETMTFYQADKEEPWIYFWIGFSGKRAAEYLEDLGLNSEQLIFRTEKGNELRDIVLKMLKNHNLSINNQYLLQSLLYEYFAVLVEDIKFEGDSENSLESLYVKRAIGFIRNSYQKGIKVTDIAQYVCISRSYLHMLFKKHLDMSPQEFLTKFRISRAKEVLTISDLSVEEVAKTCGYDDTLVFSKAFKKIVGVPPSVYRKEHRRSVKKDLVQHQKSIDALIHHT